MDEALQFDKSIALKYWEGDDILLVSGAFHINTKKWHFRDHLMRPLSYQNMAFLRPSMQKCLFRDLIPIPFFLLWPFSYQGCQNFTSPLYKNCQNFAPFLQKRPKFGQNCQKFTKIAKIRPHAKNGQNLTPI